MIRLNLGANVVMCTVYGARRLSFDSCLPCVGFMERVKSGDARYTSGGFGGKGLERIDKERDRALLVQKHVSLSVYGPLS